MKTLHFLLAPLLFLLLLSCGERKTIQIFPADHPEIRYSGRIDFENKKQPVLIGSASFVEVAFSGDSCQVWLKKLNPKGEHNYVSVELDGQYLGRIRLESDSLQPYTIDVSDPAKKHTLRIFKATEAQNGNVAFGGIRSEALQSLPSLPKRKIEFIGNSITCGMGIDWKEIPCDSGVWYDQHNAYWAYGPRVARKLNANFVLSSVSGIGVYRNWNSAGPVMPDVYENMYLNTEGKKWNFSHFTPDLVSIALGTNDFSEGDGINERLPFDSAKFVARYIDFVKTVTAKYPDAQICLLTSPMVSGKNGDLFFLCLNAVKAYFKNNRPGGKAIAVFNFPRIAPHGCGYHPDKEDHKAMAEALVPFYKQVMNWE